MNRKEVLIAIVFFILGAFIVYLFNFKNVSPPRSKYLDETSKKQDSKDTKYSIKIIDNNVKENNEIEKFTINARYPQVEGLYNTQSQNQINRSIKEIIDREVDTFKQEAINNSTLSNLEYSLNTDYEVAQTTNSIVSILLKIYSFTGGAHGQNYNLTFNYDVLSNKQLSLQDLFKPDSNYLQTLSDISIKDLLSQSQPNPYYPDYAKDTIQQGAFPKADNFKLFTLERDGLVLIFDPYQVASYAEGTKKVKIPYHKFLHILNQSIKDILDIQYSKPLNGT